MNRFKKCFLYFFLFFFLLVVILFQRIKHKHYKNEAYYHTTIEQIEKVKNKKNSNESFKVSWSKKNITPSQPIHLAGYGWQRDKTQKVRDSVYVRCCLISQAGQVYAILSYDLMIVSPLISQLLNSKKNELGIDGFYFSATHTHHSFGGWDNSLLGAVAMGGYQQEIVDDLVRKSVLCIQEAKNNLSEAAISYKEIQTKGMVLNKFSKEAYTDKKIRCIELKNKTQRAILCSFAAHANVTPSKTLEISNDYPGFFIKTLEDSPHYDFALFCAGAVGLHVGDYSKIKKTYEGVKAYGQTLAHLVLADTTHMWQNKTNIFHHQYKVWLPAPTLKVTNCISLRPWLFNTISKRENFSYIVQLNLGKVSLIGMPADFSGELYSKIDRQDLMITSFNGDYIGYIIPDGYYLKDKNESKALNWYGPRTGSYFTTLINKINRNKNE